MPGELVGKPPILWLAAGDDDRHEGEPEAFRALSDEPPNDEGVHRTLGRDHTGAQRTLGDDRLHAAHDKAGISQHTETIQMTFHAVL